MRAKGVILQTRVRFFSWISGAFAVLGTFAACAAGAVNPRSFGSENMTRLSNNSVQTRSAMNRSRVAAGGRGAITDSNATRVRAAAPSRTSISLARTAVRSGNAPISVSGAARALKTGNVSRAARGAKTINFGSARSGIARATAVFSDVSKIGSGYAACRESYATCMDQICAAANDSYRRCFCSDRLTQFRDTENALDQAMIMLQQFQDNNLNAVDKTAAEVEAMYSATVGEQAIKRDTSAAAQMLDNINDLLSGKKSTSLSAGSTNSLGVLDLDFSSDLGDIWSSDASSIFSSDRGDLSTLEGVALFNAAQRQCVQLSQDSCENDAVFSMSKSSYNILITQDCNIYEKTLNTKREKVAAAVRTAEKYLREARLEEYRSHNSADVNECIAKVRTAILADTACGEKYKRCLDPTGAYINTEGEAIYTPRLFQLEDTISLSGWNDTNSDILAQNQRYEKHLDGYRKYVTRELDSCRDIADFVWSEFKRNAIIEIAQAQSEKIEEVKSSCVGTITQCYDSTAKQLADMDKNTATAAGALGRYTAQNTCKEKVVMCALLWAPNNSAQCEFDGRGHITSANETSCGLSALWNYVETVNSLGVVDKCVDAIDEYVKDLCTPPSGTSSYGYPYECRLLSKEELSGKIEDYAVDNCSDPTVTPKPTDISGLGLEVNTKVDSVIKEIETRMQSTLRKICENKDGLWYDTQGSGTDDLSGFYDEVFGTGKSSNDYSDWGQCTTNNEKNQCELDEGVWNANQNECTPGDNWYKDMCENKLEGYYEGDVCYIEKY